MLVFGVGCRASDQVMRVHNMCHLGNPGSKLLLYIRLQKFGQTVDASGMCHVRFDDHVHAELYKQSITPCKLCQVAAQGRKLLYCALSAVLSVQLRTACAPVFLNTCMLFPSTP